MAEPPAPSHFFPPSSFQSGTSPFISSSHDISASFHLPPQNPFSTRFVASNESKPATNFTITEPALDLEDMMLDHGPGFSPSSYDEADILDAACDLDEIDAKAPSSQDMDVDNDPSSTIRRKRKFTEDVVFKEDPLAGVASRIKRLKLPPTATDDGHKIHVFVKTVTGKRVELIVDPDDIVLRIKEQLEQVSSIPAAQQRLVFQGKHMADLQVLHTYKVAHGSTLYMVTQLTGG